MPSEGDRNYYEGSNLPWEYPFHTEGDAMPLPKVLTLSQNVSPGFCSAKHELKLPVCNLELLAGISCLEQLLELEIKGPVSLSTECLEGKSKELAVFIPPEDKSV